MKNLKSYRIFLEEAEFDVPVAIEAPVIVTEDTTNNNVPLTF